jgi:hypothetical protein
LLSPKYRRLYWRTDVGQPLHFSGIVNDVASPERAPRVRPGVIEKLEILCESNAGPLRVS